MTPNKETFANDASSILDGSIDDSQTSIDVVDGSVFPSAQFRLIIDDELMLATDRSTDTLTVERGIEGSVAASHANAAPISHIVTAGSLAATVRDNDALAGSRPTLRIVDASGNPLTAADFTTVNLNGTVTDSNGNIVLRHSGQPSGDDMSGFYIAAPSAPWVQVAAVRLAAVSNAASGNEHFLGGMIVRESSSGRLIIHGVGKLVGTPAPQILIANLTNPTNFNNAILAETSFILGSLIWLKIEDDTTNLIFSISDDGEEWIECLSVSRTAWLTGGADGVGIASRHANAHTRDSIVKLCAWYTE